MALTNYERVGKAVQLLAGGLAPFIDRECRAEFGDDWPVAVQRMDTRGGGGAPRRINPADAQFLLKVLWDEWRTIFGKKLSRSDRNYVSELQGVRNSWAHNDAFSTDDALRALDTAQRLLESVAAGPQANEVSKLHQDLLRQKFDQQARGARRKAAAVQLEGRPATGLPGWREVVTPHEDVTSGRFELAEFAADLHQVWRGEAAAEYGDPTEFFRRTFITEGISNLIVGAAGRFSGAGGDPVIKLQTNFGGGKTHALIALYHLAGGAGPGELPGVEEILAEHGLDLPAGRPIRRAVLVGHQLQPSSASKKPDGTVVNTMWGELAWQLDGAEGYELVAESDRAGTNPGEALTELLRACSPCLVLIDEWVAYARQLHGVSGLPAGSFDAHFSFAQALTDAARNSPEALLVATIPASDIEVGGEGGRVALTKLEHLFSRMETNWRTASTEESFEIVRRRLFGGLGSEAARQRDAVVKAFGDLYRAQAQRNEFPSECGEGDYERRMKAAYPIHPELFDRLFGDWSELERFQRTRGVLRLMAKVIHSLWVRSDSGLLIMPATIPIDDNDVAAELIRYLDDGWRPVIETDIDGPESLPLKLDKANPNLGRYSAARRIARTVYFGSAPSQEAANKGLDDRSIKLGCVQPGEAPATFGDALRRLSDQAMHLYRDGARYWYSLQPTVTRLAQDRAESHFSDADVDEEIRSRLDGVRSRPSLFAAVHACPRSPGDVPDEGSARLVVLDPSSPHDSKTDGSEALEFAERLLAERGGRGPAVPQHAGVPRRRQGPPRRPARRRPPVAGLEVHRRGPRHAQPRQLPGPPDRGQAEGVAQDRRRPGGRDLPVGAQPEPVHRRPHRAGPLGRHPGFGLGDAGRAGGGETEGRGGADPGLLRHPAAPRHRPHSAVAGRPRGDRSVVGRLHAVPVPAPLGEALGAGGGGPGRGAGAYVGDGRLRLRRRPRRRAVCGAQGVRTARRGRSERAVGQSRCGGCAALG